MKFTSLDNSTDRVLNREVVYESPSPMEAIRGLTDFIDPGQQIMGEKRFIDGNYHLLNRFELRCITPKIFTLAIEEDFEEYVMGYGYPRTYIGPRVASGSQRSYHGSFLIFDGELLGGASSEPVLTNTDYSYNPSLIIPYGQELSGRDLQVFESMRNDIVAGEMQMKVGYNTTSGAFGNGMPTVPVAWDNPFLKDVVRLELLAEKESMPAP